jgi:hypothetical protein
MTRAELQNLHNALWLARGRLDRTAVSTLDVYERQQHTQDRAQLTGALAVVDRELKQPQPLLFASVGHQLWQVEERIFGSSNAMLATLHRLVCSPGVAIPCCELSSARNAMEGARGKLKTTLREISMHSPGLAEALRAGVSVKRGVLRYQRGTNAAVILGNVLGNASNDPQTTSTARAA